MPVEEIEPPVGVTATVVAAVSVLSVYAVTTGSGSAVAVAAAGETGANAIRKWPLCAMASIHVTVTLCPA